MYTYVGIAKIEPDSLMPAQVHQHEDGDEQQAQLDAVGAEPFGRPM